MKKVAEWIGMTQTHGFSVQVYRDATNETFIAQVQTSSPALVPQHIPGTPTPTMDFGAPEVLKHKELDQLCELTKQQIANRCGKIVTFFEN